MRLRLLLLPCTSIPIFIYMLAGFEWGFLSSWRADTPGLPYMLAVEFHLDRLSTGPGPLQPNPGADVSRFDQMWGRQTISQVGFVVTLSTAPYLRMPIPLHVPTCATHLPTGGPGPRHVNGTVPYLTPP